MAAERATAAEMMAPAAAVVMVGIMLGLGRVGGGSGCLLGLRRHGLRAASFGSRPASFGSPPPPLCFVWLTPYIFHIPPKFSQAVGVGAPDLRTTLAPLSRHRSGSVEMGARQT